MSACEQLFSVFRMCVFEPLGHTLRFKTTHCPFSDGNVSKQFHCLTIFALVFCFSFFTNSRTSKSCVFINNFLSSPGVKNCFSCKIINLSCFWKIRPFILQILLHLKECFPSSWVCKIWDYCKPQILRWLTVIVYNYRYNDKLTILLGCRANC